jgi:hypothetical protein
MATLLRETLHLKTPDELYDLVESGWNATVASLELARRGLPAVRPKPKRMRRRRGHMGMRAKRIGGITSGYVDRSKVTPLPKPSLPGSSIPPYL